MDAYCFHNGGLPKIAIRIEGPRGSNSFTHSISLSGTSDQSLAITISGLYT